MSLSSICELHREQLRKGRGRGETIPHIDSICSLWQKKSGKQKHYSLGESPLEESRPGPRIWSIPLMPMIVEVWKGVR